MSRWGVDGNQCTYQSNPARRFDWVSTDGIYTNPDSEIARCPREAAEGHDYCRFHLPPEERDDEWSAGEALRDRLKQVVAGEVPPTADEFSSYQGAVFDEIDLSGINAEVLDERGFDLDLRYTRVEGQVNLLDLQPPSTSTSCIPLSVYS